MSAGKISVCVASYNGEEHIIRQLDSILDQLGPSDEVIVSDDSSTDATALLISQLGDSRIIFVTNTSTKGPVGNFQNALTRATGDFIFLSDQDDIWLSGKVAEMTSLLHEFDLVLSDCKIVDKNLSVIQPSFFKYRSSKAGLLRNMYKNSFMGCCMAFRRNVLSYALPIPQKVHMHDWWIGLLAEVKGKVYFYDKPLILYVRHGNNASPTGEGEYNLYQKLYNRFILLSLLVKRILR